VIVGIIDQRFSKLIMGVYVEARLVPGLIVFASRPPSVAVPTCRALTCRKSSYGLVLVYVAAPFLSPWRIDRCSRNDEVPDDLGRGSLLEVH